MTKKEEISLKEKVNEILGKQKITITINATPDRSVTTIDYETTDAILHLIKEREDDLLTQAGNICIEDEAYNSYYEIEKLRLSDSAIKEDSK